MSKILNDNAPSAKYIHMIETPVERLVCSLALPTITIMLISSFYNMADTYFVGSLGTQATAAVGVSFSLMNLIQAMGYFLGHGVGNYAARQLGAQNREAAVRMAATGFVSAIAAGAAVTASGLYFLNPFARLLGATDTILPYACDYLFYILIGAPWMIASFMMNTLLRFQGSAAYGMWGMVSGAVLNILLDPLFIFVFGMGVRGAALATMMSQFVGFSLLLLGCFQKDNIRIDFRKFSPRFSSYKEIVRGGFPSLLRQGFTSVSTICLNRLAGGYGDATIAGMSIVLRVTHFANAVMLGFGQGFQPVCGFNYGAKRYDRVKKAFWFCIKISSAALFFLALIGFLLAPQIVALFRRDDLEVIRVGTLALRLQCVIFPVMGWIHLNNMMMQTIGKAFSASFLAMSRQGLFLLPVLFILAPRLGILGIQSSQPISDFLTFLLAIPLGIKVLRELDTNPPDSAPREHNEPFGTTDL